MGRWHSFDVRKCEEINLNSSRNHVYPICNQCLVLERYVIGLGINDQHCATVLGAHPQQLPGDGETISVTVGNGRAVGERASVGRPYSSLSFPLRWEIDRRSCGRGHVTLMQSQVGERLEIEIDVFLARRAGGRLAGDQQG